MIPFCSSVLEAVTAVGIFAFEITILYYVVKMKRDVKKFMENEQIGALVELFFGDKGNDNDV